jgi:beta-galactosidase
VKDSSGNGNNGTITGAPTYAAGKIGSALTLNGTADYVDCGAAASLDILNAVTLSVWIKPANFANSAYQTFVSKGDHAYCLHHTNGNVIEFYIYNTGWRSINGGPVTSTYNATWHHVAGTYDGSQLKLYVDGKMAGSTLWTGTIDTATHSVSIGRNSEQSGRLFNGAIDDVRIYRGALPTSEIVKLANP